MLLAILIATALVASLIGGKTLILMLWAQPVIGSFATWYMGHIGDLAPGHVANLIYAGMAAQVIVLFLAQLLYGPTAIRKLIHIARKYKQTRAAAK